MIITRPDGSKVSSITWQKPEIWMVRGHKCFMYQTSNKWLLWRVGEVKRPDGSIIENDVMRYRTNISASKKRAVTWLEMKIKWDGKSSEEREAWVKENSPPQGLLW